MKINALLSSLTFVTVYFDGDKCELIQTEVPVLHEENSQTLHVADAAIPVIPSGREVVLLRHWPKKYYVSDECLYINPHFITGR